MGDLQLTDRGKVLVVGSLMHRAWEPYRSHPQVVFWTDEGSRRHKAIRNGQLPQGVEAVVMSRFVGHREGDPLRAEARKRGLRFFGPLDDGAITRLLAQVQPLTPSSAVVVPGFDPAAIQRAAVAEARAAMEPPVEARVWQPGELTAFVREHYQVGNPLPVEVERLVGLAAAQGISSNAPSMRVAVSHLRRHLGLTPKGRREAPAPAPSPPPAVAPDPLVTVTPVGPGTLVVPDEASQHLLKLIDDAMAAMALVREEVLASQQARVDYLALKAKLAELAK